MITLAPRTSPVEFETFHSDTPVSFNEAARVAALHDYAILDTPRESSFDDITRLATIACGTPMAAINLVDADRQWFKSEVGLGPQPFPIGSSICAHAILGADLFIVPDLHEDPRFVANPLVVSEPHLRFYAGAPLVTPDGHVLGMMCVLDHVPRELEPTQAEMLRSLSRLVMTQLELRRRVRRANQFLREMILATRQLQHTGEDLQRADIAKDEILGMISHELRTPLMIIDGNVRIAEKTEVDVEGAAALAEIGVASKRMSRLISNMMVLARDDHAATIQREPLVLRHSFAAALAEHARLFPRSPVALEADPDLPPVIGDETSIDQVLTNLLSNAGKYGDPTEPITVKAVHRDGVVLVTVANGGEVLEPENIERLFEPFFREGAHHRNTPGIGLGLAVCRRLIVSQKGNIWATARPGGGLEVSFTLPVEEA